MKREDIVLLDGAVGTSLWEKAPDKQPVWKYNIERPEIVRELCDEYVNVGAKIILANTFGANRMAVSRSSEYSVNDVVSAGVRLAKEAVNGRAEVALSVGPLMDLLEPYGNVTYEEAEEYYREQIGAGMEEKPDVILIQTFIDLEMMIIAVKVAKTYDVPVFCAMSFDKNGRTMMGNSVSDMVNGLAEYKVDAVGLNCSIGPEAAVPVMKQFRDCTDMPLLFKPNAGTPIMGSDGTPHTALNAMTFASDVLPVLEYNVKYIGGCCGTNPSYIKCLGQELDKRLK